jgi:hypothetical protein
MQMQVQLKMFGIIISNNMPAESLRVYSSKVLPSPSTSESLLPSPIA